MPSYANLNLTALCREGRLKEALHILLTTHKPPGDSNTYLQLLQICIAKNVLSLGKQIHSLITHRGFVFSLRTTFPNKLIDMYVKCGSLIDARKMFEEMKEQNVSSWNTIIAAYRKHGFSREALILFHQMQRTGVEADEFTFASILPACAKLRALEQDVVVASALVDMYAKCGSICKARALFDEMPQKNVVSWNVMIAGYAQNGFLEEALKLFKEMSRPDVVSWSAIVAGYAKNGFFENALETFKQMQLAGYAQNGFVEQALQTFKQMQLAGLKPDSATLVTILPTCAKIGALEQGYAQNGFVEKALETFKQMIVAAVKPDSTTFASILPLSAKLGGLEQGRGIHQRIIESGILSDVIVANALTDMYAKCGSIYKARYAQNGLCKDALELFELMKYSGMNPDHISYTCVLFACSHAGLVDEGCKYFNFMSDSYCILPTIDHYVCIIDLLSRGDYLEETLNFIIKMPIKPVEVVWTCLLAVCRSHKNIELGVFTAKVLLELDPKDAATYVLLSNIYAEIGWWRDVQMIRRLMKERGVIKLPGCSWIESHKMVNPVDKGERVVEWDPPECGWTKINLDGASRVVRGVSLRFRPSTVLQVAFLGRVAELRSGYASKYIGGRYGFKEGDIVSGKQSLVLVIGRSVVCKLKGNSGRVGSEAFLIILEASVVVPTRPGGLRKSKSGFCFTEIRDYHTQLQN
ncbi:pentatricopeptide repeat-containing protein At2g13600-like [Cryptomeria japonica]|uniref:pentatricopeptide repeat-containing protein At2g13600-like n=1 Tax=Cryptomeria japonica TaxID=3369 RepID=UPI0027DA4478|nr:pentatricopeptide repeat-containing protein At2g13600-like [Cryptomeria japonica]